MPPAKRTQPELDEAKRRKDERDRIAKRLKVERRLIAVLEEAGFTLWSKTLMVDETYIHGIIGVQIPLEEVAKLPTHLLRIEDHKYERGRVTDICHACGGAPGESWHIR